MITVEEKQSIVDSFVSAWEFMANAVAHQILLIPVYCLNDCCRK